MRQQSRSRKENPARTQYAKMILSMLDKIRKLATDKSGMCTRITYVDKVFRDLYGIKAFCRRTASCKTVRQAFVVFTEVGLTKLWNLMNDEMYYKVMSLLVDVQERKDELKKIIRKSQKKLQSSGGTMRVDQKSKHNKRISNAQAELKWLNKRYKDSIESLQDSLGIHNPDSGDYKDRFAALKNFADRGTISSNNYWDMEDDGYDFFNTSFDDPFTMRRKSSNPFEGIDLDSFEDDMVNEQQDDRLDRIEDQIKALTSMIQNGGNRPVQKNPYAPSSKGIVVDDNGTRVQPSPIESKMIEMMNIFGQSIDNLNNRLDNIEDAIVNDPDNDSDDYGYQNSYGQPDPSFRPVNGPTQEDLERMMQGVPQQGIEPDTSPYSPDIKEMPYQPTEPKIPGVPMQKDIRRTSSDTIDANNRQEVFQKPTDYQKMQDEAKTPLGNSNSNP